MLLALASAGGCRPSLEQSADAVAWKSQTADPLEAGKDTDNWPGWRGRNGAGVASGGAPPVQFSPTNRVLWKIDVPGGGNSSPMIWGRYLVLTTALDTHPATLAVLCFDRTDGRQVWQADAGRAVGGTHVKNGYASATATTDGRHIFVFFGGAGLFCYDFSGKQLWHEDLGPLEHMWGTASSPVCCDQRVIQLCDCNKGSYLAAFDKITGRELWRTPRPSGGCWSTPVLVDVESPGGSHAEIVVNGTNPASGPAGLVIAYAPEDGRELWRVEGTKDLVTPLPLVAGGLVFSASGRNGPIMAIRPGGSGNVTHTRVVWNTHRGGPYIPSGVAYRGRLYFVADNGMVTCYNPGDGKSLWHGQLRGDFTSSLVAAEGRLYALSEQGTAYVFAAGDEKFQLLATNPLGETCYATPAIVDHKLYLRTQKHLYCFGE